MLGFLPGGIAAVTMAVRIVMFFRFEYKAGAKPARNTRASRNGWLAQGASLALPSSETAGALHSGARSLLRRRLSWQGSA